MREITITSNDAGRRLDRFLRKYLQNAPLSVIYKTVRKDIKVNGKRQDTGYMLSEGDILTLYLPDDVLLGYTEARQEDRPKVRRNFGILYEDEHILVADKPFGLLTHGDRREKKNHLANQVRDYLIETGEFDPRTERIFSPAPANRLDRNTTGIVLFGKDSDSLRTLNAMIREDRVGKYYQTIVYGTISRELHLGGHLVKDPKTNTVRVLPADGKVVLPGEAKAIETIVRPVRGLRNCTLVEVELVTGRTHQIRAHLASIGHPVIGDSKYAAGPARAFNQNLRKIGLSTQLLHCARIELREAEGPLAYLRGRTFTAELPEKFRRIQRELEGK